jgi:Mitochondrial carrier protein
MGAAEFTAGLQTQNATTPYFFKGPLDAVKQIYSQHGISGIYKGQAVTIAREAAGYGIYFLTYEKLVEREMNRKGIKRHQINPLSPILYGAAAGYAVRCLSHARLCLSISRFISVVGHHIPHRRGQDQHANRRFYAFHWAEILIDLGLRSQDLEERWDCGVHQRPYSNTHSVCD